MCVFLFAPSLAALTAPSISGRALARRDSSRAGKGQNFRTRRGRGVSRLRGVLRVASLNAGETSGVGRREMVFATNERTFRARA